MEAGWSVLVPPPADAIVGFDDDYRSPVFFQILGCFAWECVEAGAWVEDAAR